MNNKRLEERLKKRGNVYDKIIQVIERCESGQVAEIRISKDEGFTDSAILDKMILTYLKKLKITVVFIEKEEEEAEGDGVDDGKPKCQHEVHRVLNSDIKKSAKIKALLKGKHPMLKVDITSFVICPTCFDIKEVK